ncbi:MAG: TolC family protein [Fibromonadaceae bacterium]|jgi:outer membrane protein|nr:TolC family protein [Fibromonadaceae bacterium]
MPIFFIAIVLFFVNATFAQYQGLTLQNCIEIAKKNSLDLTVAKLSEKTATSSLQQAKYARLPGLSGNVSQRVSDNPLVEDSEVSYGFSMGVNSSMPIFTAGRIGHQVKRAGYLKEVAELNSEAVSKNLSELVIEAYMRVWSLIESENSAKASLALSKRMLARDSVLFRSGSFTASDLALAFAQVASDSLNLLQVQSNLVQNYTALRQLLEIPAGAAFSLLPPDSAKTEATESYANLLALAQQHSIDRKMDSLSVLAATEAIGVQNAYRYPSMSLSGSLSSGLRWETQDPKYQTQMKNSFGYTASLSLNIPIVDWGSAKDGVLQAQVAQERAQIAAINTQKRLENTIERLALQVETYRLQWEVSTIQMEAQKLSLDKSVQQHELGMLDISSLIQQQTIFNNSQIRHNQAKYSYLLGKSLLNLQTGKF